MTAERNKAKHVIHFMGEAFLKYRGSYLTKWNLRRIRPKLTDAGWAEIDVYVETNAGWRPVDKDMLLEAMNQELGK